MAVAAEVMRRARMSSDDLLNVIRGSRERPPLLPIRIKSYSVTRRAADRPWTFVAARTARAHAPATVRAIFSLGLS